MGYIELEGRPAIQQEGSKVVRQPEGYEDVTIEHSTGQELSSAETAEMRQVSNESKQSSNVGLRSGTADHWLPSMNTRLVMYERGHKDEAMTKTEVIGHVRSLAEGLTASGRAELLYDLAREVYEVEKFNGAGGEGLDNKNSVAREALGGVCDAADKARNTI